MLTFFNYKMCVYTIVSVGAASKRFGIDKEREAVPLTLRVAYNKVLFLDIYSTEIITCTVFLT